MNALRAEGRLILLLTLALLISYIDRGNLAIIGPLVQDELKLTPSQFGALGTAFYITYVLCMFPAGWLAERFGAQRVLAVGMGIWAVATLLMGFSASYAGLFAMRLLLGIGESSTFPCMSQLVASRVRPERNGVANGWVAFGYLIGPAIGAWIGGNLMQRHGWRPVCVVFGALSLLWLIPWLRLRLSAAPQAAAPVAAAVSTVPTLEELLSVRALRACSLGHFAGNYSFYLLLTWLPTYLIKSRGFSAAEMTTATTIAYFINAAGGVSAGWATDRWSRAGHSLTSIYKSIMALNFGGSILCMIGLVSLPIAPALACLYAYQLIVGFSSPGVFAISQIFAGPSATGRWVGIQNLIGNIAGLLAPILTGVLIDLTGHYNAAFYLAAVVNVLGIVGWVLWLPAIAPINWATVRSALAARRSER